MVVVSLICWCLLVLRHVQFESWRAISGLHPSITHWSPLRPCRHYINWMCGQSVLTLIQQNILHPSASDKQWLSHQLLIKQERWLSRPPPFEKQKFEKSRHSSSRETLHCGEHCIEENPALWGLVYEYSNKVAAIFRKSQDNFIVGKYQCAGIEQSWPWPILQGNNGHRKFKVTLIWNFDLRNTCVKFEINWNVSWGVIMFTS